MTHDQVRLYMCDSDGSVKERERGRAISAGNECERGKKDREKKEQSESDEQERERERDLTSRVFPWEETTAATAAFSSCESRKADEKHSLVVDQEQKAVSRAVA